MKNSHLVRKPGTRACRWQEAKAGDSSRSQV